MAINNCLGNNFYSKGSRRKGELNFLAFQDDTLLKLCSLFKIPRMEHHYIMKTLGMLSSPNFSLLLMRMPGIQLCMLHPWNNKSGTHAHLVLKRRFFNNNKTVTQQRAFCVSRQLTLTLTLTVTMTFQNVVLSWCYLIKLNRACR